MGARGAARRPGPQTYKHPRGHQKGAKIAPMQRLIPSLLAWANRIDRVNTAIGRAAAWCVLFMVVVQFAVVMLRYLFGIGSIWLSESILYAHATMFLLAAAWTLIAGGHVRVDIFYADASPRRRALVDFLGAL